MSVVPDRRYAWRLVQVAELLRRSHRLHEEALAELDRVEVAGHLAADGSITLSAPTTGELERCAEAIADLASQLRLLTNDLPAETVEIAARDVAREAMADLEAGIFDEQRALLAARVLSAEEGWPALVEALLASDAHWGWDTTSITDVLSAFRHVDLVEVARVVEEAGVDPHLPLGLCTAEQIGRLAAAIDRGTVTGEAKS